VLNNYYQSLKANSFMANQEKIKKNIRERRRRRVRAKVFGTRQKPRLNVFRSLKHLYVQLIDDSRGVTLAAVKDQEISASQETKTGLAFKVGELIATKAKKLGIESVVFDKAYYQYHGRLKAVAEGARKGGLKF
jgi:large subunit ribosomal protein L18